MSARARLLLSSSGHTTLQVLEPYCYGALPEDSIRLLELHSGANESELVGNLVTRRMDESPQYMALSYVWGDPTSTGHLLCAKDRPADSNSNFCTDHGPSDPGSDPRIRLKLYLWF